MATLTDLPTELFEQIVHILAADGKGLLALRALNKQYRDYIDRMLPEIAWRLSGIEDGSKPTGLSWIDQQMDNELRQIRAAYWDRPGAMSDAGCAMWRWSKKRGRQQQSIMTPHSSFGPLEEDWWLQSDELFGHILTEAEVFAREDWWLDSDDALFPHILANFEGLACEDWWILYEGDLPAILAYLEDSSYPLVEPTPWWIVPSSSSSYIFERLRHPATDRQRFTYRNLMRISRLVKLRDAINFLSRLSMKIPLERDTTIRHLQTEEFLEYQAIILGGLRWERPPSDIARVSRWAFTAAFEVDRLRALKSLSGSSCF